MNVHSESVKFVMDFCVICFSVGFLVLSLQTKARKSTKKSTANFTTKSVHKIHAYSEKTASEHPLCRKRGLTELRQCSFQREGMEKATGDLAKPNCQSQGRGQNLVADPLSKLKKTIQPQLRMTKAPPCSPRFVAQCVLCPYAMRNGNTFGTI